MRSSLFLNVTRLILTVTFWRFETTNQSYLQRPTTFLKFRDSLPVPSAAVVYYTWSNWHWTDRLFRNVGN